MKLFCPDIVQVTTVWPPSGRNVNSAVLVAWNGLTNQAGTGPVQGGGSQ